MSKHTNYLHTVTESLQNTLFSTFNLSIVRPSYLRLLRPTTQHSRLISLRAQPRGIKPTKHVRLRDEEIQSPFVQLVSEDLNTIQPPEPPSSILARIDRKNYFLVQVARPDLDSSTVVCKIIPKHEAREFETKRFKRPKTSQSSMKELELNWAIGPNDFRHKMDRLGQFLNEGRKVNILLEAKKRKGKGRDAAPDEAMALVERLKDFVQSLDGAKEYKEMEGVVGGRLQLYFIGKAVKRVVEDDEQKGKQEGRHKEGGADEERQEEVRDGAKRERFARKDGLEDRRKQSHRREHLN